MSESESQRAGGDALSILAARHRELTDAVAARRAELDAAQAELDGFAESVQAILAGEAVAAVDESSAEPEVEPEQEADPAEDTREAAPDAPDAEPEDEEAPGIEIAAAPESAPVAESAEEAPAPAPEPEAPRRRRRRALEAPLGDRPKRRRIRRLRKPGQPTQRDALLSVLQLGEGLTVEQAVDSVKEKHDMDLLKNSAATTLSMLKRQGLARNENKLWFRMEKESE